MVLFHPIYMWQLSPLEWTIMVTALGSGALGALGVGGYLYYQSRARIKQRRIRQERHLARLQRLTSKLLNSYDRLLGGSTPEETILYQRFKAHGGEYFQDIQAEVYKTLRHSQHALRIAFDLHQKLNDPALHRNRALERRIWDWEKLYVALVGAGERTRSLTADELRVLLDPMLSAEGEVLDGRVAQELNDLRRELTDAPLNVEWQMIQPDQVASGSILDYVDWVKDHINRLPERHRQVAPRWFAEARRQYQIVETEAPPFLPELYDNVVAHTQERAGSEEITTPQVKLSGRVLLADIGRRLGQIQDDLARDQFLLVVEQSATVLKDLETVRAFLKALNDHGRRLTQIDAITAYGYRPLQLADDLYEIGVDVQAIIRLITTGDYVGAAPWIEELNIDSRRALTGTRLWRDLHDQNVADLHDLRTEVTNATENWYHQVISAWEKLQAYARENWADLAGQMEPAKQVLQRLNNDRISQIESLNSVEIQKFTEAEQMLTRTRADLARVEEQGRVVVNRLAEVQAAEVHIAEALRLAEADLNRAELLRDEKDSKIGPEVDKQIQEARYQLARAKRLRKAGQYVAAMEAQMTARQLATAAYVAADQQVREIKQLQEALELKAGKVHRRIKWCLAQVKELPAVVQTPSTNRLSQHLIDRLSAAARFRTDTTDLEDQALASALQEALDTYDEVGQLVDWTIRQINIDRQEHTDYFYQAVDTLAAARVAIQEAEEAICASHAGEAEQRALQRSRRILRLIDVDKDNTKEALARARQQAKEAYHYARQAESRIRLER